MLALNKIKHSGFLVKNLIFRLDALKLNLLRISPSKHFVSSNRFASDICSYEDLIKVLETKVKKERERVAKFKKQSGKEKVGEVTVTQLYGGMRGILGFICDTSELDPEEGIRFRGYTLKEIEKKLPKAECGKEPLPEGIFLLLLTGDIPRKETVKFLSKMWAENGKLPAYVEKIIKSFPKDLHPMSQLSMAVCGLNKDSKFNTAFNKNVPRTDYWKYVLDDAMHLLAKLPAVAAMIYNNSFKEGKGDYDIDCELDWGANFANMLGYADGNFYELMRLYLTIHCDHEGGNVSAHACHLVGSALSDPYLSFSAGLNGLAGPLHGRANQDVLTWLDEVVKAKGANATEQDIKDFCKDEKKQPCRIIPGYGHAVLRKTDPRFISQMEYAKRNMPNDPMIKLVATCYKAVPEILGALGKVSNPWPNVDAHSGVLLRYFGLKEQNYYTVLFGISRALGTMAQLVWARALMFPIERPRTITTSLLMAKVAENKNKDCDSGAKK